MLLLVDAEGEAPETWQALADDAGVGMTMARDPEETLRVLLRPGPLPDLVLVHQPAMGHAGWMLVETLRQQWPGLPLVVLVGATAVQDAVTAMRLGAWEALPMPLTVEDLRAVVGRLPGGPTGAILTGVSPTPSGGEHCPDLAVLKQRFSEIASHSMGTPLNLVMDCVALLEDSPGLAEQRTIVGILKRAAGELRVMHTRMRAMRNLIEPTPLNPNRFDLSLLLQEVVGEILPQARELSQRIQIQCAPNLFIRADRDKLGLTWKELVDNAVRFGGEGGEITLSAAMEGDGWLRAEIHDSGAGIPPQDQTRVFEPFYDAMPALNRPSPLVRGEGLGLGLALARAMVEAHGGRIWAGSSRHGGACIGMVLPQQHAGQSVAQAAGLGAAPH